VHLEGRDALLHGATSRVEHANGSDAVGLTNARPTSHSSFEVHPAIQALVIREYCPNLRCLDRNRGFNFHFEHGALLAKRTDELRASAATPSDRSAPPSASVVK